MTKITPKLFQALQWFADNDGVQFLRRGVDPSPNLVGRLSARNLIRGTAFGNGEYIAWHITPLGRATLAFGNHGQGEVYMNALNLACAMLIRHEPGDSRAVSDEFVALASVAAGVVSPDVVRVIDAGLAKFDPDITLTVDTSRRARSREVCGND